MADDADMRNELSDMQQRADQLADEVRMVPVVTAHRRDDTRPFSPRETWHIHKNDKNMCRWLMVQFFNMTNI